MTGKRELIRRTNHPGVVELRSDASRDRIWLDALINSLLASYPAMFFCPHEPDEGMRSGAKYRHWVQVVPTHGSSR